ncbi:uncharacterized protein LOC132700861 [Cylas formicarius]|uniref:uncharacterized protein LOC132700861 n=1 Tax=Cylas formicarius TaxID=197179 RepID=UPI0029588F2E|nr:uncharacterized protein LOC132700861 [Cylas formicarius]
MPFLTSICFILIAAQAHGEPLGYSYHPNNEKTEVEIQKVEVYEVPWVGDLPPQQQYGPPQKEYGPPRQQYGPPQPPSQEGTTTSYPDLTTTSLPANATNSTSDEGGNNTTNVQNAKLQSGTTEQGQYYVYHPSGVLQRVAYVTRDDPARMEFSARLMYRNVEPVRGPIYTYDPDTYVFSRINKYLKFTGKHNTQSSSSLCAGSSKKTTMFVVVLFVAILASALAEAPSRTDQARPQTNPEFAPYLPSGWKPSGPIFRFPDNPPIPVTFFSPPPDQPPLSYGPPSDATTPLPDLTTTESITEITTTEYSETKNETAAQLQKEDLRQQEQDDKAKLNESEDGIYYIYHPSGLLQRVVYSTRNDAQNMAFSAKLKYENVDPISGPVYTYDAQSFAFMRLY